MLCKVTGKYANMPGLSRIVRDGIGVYCDLDGYKLSKHGSTLKED